MLVRAMLPFMPDRFVVRHLFVHFEELESESLLGHEDYANPYFQEAYDLLAEHGIQTECVPLMKKPGEVSAAPAGSAEAVSEESGEKVEGCMFMHRTSTMHCDGNVAPCCIPSMPLAGRFDGETSFLDVWNGPVMQGVRRSFGTNSEWEQCRNCHFRQCRIKSQRDGALGGTARVDLKQGILFNRKSGEYRERSAPQTLP